MTDPGSPDDERQEKSRWRAVIVKYQQPSTARATWQIINTFVPYGLLWYAMYVLEQTSLWLTIPVAILAGVKGADLERAMHFVEFLLSREGQLLWAKRPGTPGGPTERALRRPPVRPDVYADQSDWADHTNPFYDEDKDGDSVEVAVNHWLNANGCTDKTWTMTAGTPAAPDEAVCRSYPGCGRFPVELCLTDGKGHAAQETLSLPGFWQMFQQSLPK